MVFLDKYGNPIWSIRDRPIKTWLAWLIHTRRVLRGTWEEYQARQPSQVKYR